MRQSDAPTLLALWDAAVARFTQRPALGIGLDATVPFVEADTAANGLANDLHDHGLQPGHPVVVDLTRGPAWLPVLLGVWKAGGVAVPAPQHNPTAVAVLVRETGASLCIADGPCTTSWPPSYALLHHDATRSVAPRFSPVHAYAMLTSGSTGSPKLALVTHQTSAQVLSGLAAAVGIEAGEHALHVASFAFSSSIRQLFVPLLSGAQVTVFEQTHPFAPDRLLHTASTRGITSLDLTPSHLAALVQLLETDPRLPTPQALRRLLVASEVLTRGLLDRWRSVAPAPHTVVHLYGQTETGGAVSVLRGADVVTDDDSGDLRLPLAMPFPPFTAHFEHRPDGVAEMLIEGLDPADGALADGVVDRNRYSPNLPDAIATYRTGDLFEVAGNGLLYFHGRADDQVKIGGVRVDVAGLERHVAALPGVAQAVAVAVPLLDGRTKLGIAYTASASTAGPDQVSQYAGRWLTASTPAPYVLQLDQLPLNRSGKVDRPAVIQALQSMLTAAMPGNHVDPVETLWRRHTNASRVVTDSDPAPEDFFAAGGDSLSMIALLADVARTVGVRILPEQFHHQPTLNGLRQLLESQPSAATAALPQDGTAQHAAELTTVAFHRGLWINERLSSEPSPYWLPIDLHVEAVLDLGRLTNAFRATLTRFDALRLAFTEDPGRGLVMRPDTHTAATATLTRPEALAELGGITRAGGLLQIAADMDDTGTRISLRVHHAVADRPSLVTLLRFLCRAYDDPSEDPSSDDDPRSARSFLDWCRQREAAIVGDEGQAAHRYWDRALPPAATQPDSPKTPRTGQPRVECQEIIVPSLASAGIPSGTTRHASWLWAYHRALDTNGMALPRLIGVDVDIRPPGEAELVGPYVNTLPVALPERATGGDGERATGMAIAQLLPHARIPITEVVPPSRRPTGDPRQPFFRYHLVYQASEYPTLRLANHPVRYRQLPPGISEHTVTLFVRESPTGTQLQLAWDSRLVDADVAEAILDATATRFAGHKKGQR